MEGARPDTQPVTGKQRQLLSAELRRYHPMQDPRHSPLAWQSPLSSWVALHSWIAVPTAAVQVIANIAMLGGMIMFGVLVASLGNALARATAEAHTVGRVWGWGQRA